jgi:signal transduction histidine kinase
VINLLRNASEAMPEGGNVRIESSLEPGEPPHVEIRVSDEGPGVPAEVQGRLFEPFVSSKGHEGLGLSIVFSIVNELGGEIGYESSPGKGTTFTVRLPAE